MVMRYELHDGKWRRIEDRIPGKVCDPGRAGADNRLLGSGYWCVLSRCMIGPSNVAGALEELA